MPPTKRPQPENQKITGFFKRLTGRNATNLDPPASRDGPEPESFATSSRSSNNLHRGQTATPTESPVSCTIRSLPDASNVTSTTDPAECKPCTGPSARRRVSGVLIAPAESPALEVTIPSPTSSRSLSPVTMEVPPPPPPPALPPSSFDTTMTTAKPSASTAAAASFSSISTFTTVPCSSQPSGTALSVSSSSKRVIKAGLKGVTNSDSDMSEDDSSDEELADPATFFSSKRRKVSPHPDDAESISVQQKPRTRLSEEERRKKFLGPPVRSPPRKEYRNSLAQLAQQNQEWQETEAAIATMEAAVEESKRHEEEAQRVEALNVEVDEDAVIAVTGSGNEDREMMVVALEKTEALHNYNGYYFFLDDQPLFENAPFPVDALPDEPWATLYRSDVTRDQACISGFAAELAAQYPLPVTVTNWMAHQLLHEPRDTLCEGYVAVLQASSAHYASFSDTIASLSSMYKTRSLFESNWKDPVRRGLPAGLGYVMQVVQACAPASDGVVMDAAPAMTAAAILDLAMINVDELVRSDVDLCLTTSTSIEIMLDALPEESFAKLIPGVLGTFYLGDLSIHMMCRIIAALPACTPRSYRLRRELALNYFLEPSDRGRDRSRDWLDVILQALNRPEFNTSNRRTDCDLLLGLVDILDIALAAGFTPYAELHPPEPVGGRGPFAKAPPLTPAAKEHNRQIDHIVDKVKRIACNIHHAQNLSKTQAKAALERLAVRLEFAVRSKPKPKVGVFEQRTFTKPRPKGEEVMEEEEKHGSAMRDGWVHAQPEGGTEAS